MREYHKIVTVWERDPATKFKTLIEGKYATPELAYLADLEWVFTEKVDGTNVRVMWGPEGVTFGGKTDNAQMPTFLLSLLQRTFTTDAMSQAFDEMGVCLYGEGYGAKIQKGGGNYIPDGQGFILFDVRVGDVWLERHNVADVASKLGVAVVPEVGRGTLEYAVNMVRQGYTSYVAEPRTMLAEGMVMRPAVELTTRMGHRIITKVKHKDFRD